MLLMIYIQEYYITYYSERIAIKCVNVQKREHWNEEVELWVSDWGGGAVSTKCMVGWILLLSAHFESLQDEQICSHNEWEFSNI